MLKVNLKTNQLIFSATIVFMVLLIIEFYLKRNGLFASHLLYHYYSTFIEALYATLIFYLISILMFFGEKTAISVAITWYICLDILKFLAGEWPGKILDFSLTPALGILTFVALVYVLIQLFRVNNKYIALPFRLFGFSFLAVVVFKLMIAIAFPLSPGRLEMEYSSLLLILTPLSILYILKKVTDIIKSQNAQSKEIGILK